MRATAGLEPDVAALHEISLKELTELVGANFDAWNRGLLPTLLPNDMPKAAQSRDVSPVEQK